MINCDQTTETEQPIRHPISTLDIYFLFNVSMVRCDTISFKSLRCKSSLMSVQHNWALWQFDIGYWEHVKCRMMRSAEHLNWPSLRKSSAIECTSAVEMDSVHGGANSGYKWPSECSNGFFKKDIGRVVGLHHPILQTGFDEESGAIKVPHTAQEIEGGRKRHRKEEEVRAIVRNQHLSRLDVCNPKAYISPVVLTPL